MFSTEFMDNLSPLYLQCYILQRTVYRQITMVPHYGIRQCHAVGGQLLLHIPKRRECRIQILHDNSYGNVL